MAPIRLLPNVSMVKAGDLRPRSAALSSLETADCPAYRERKLVMQSTDVPDSHWQTHGRCRHATVDPELFFACDRELRSVRRSREQQAKSICRRCPVAAVCLTYAVRTHQPYGIWGGATETERRRGQRTRRPPVVTPERAQIAAGYEAGASIRDLAASSGAPYSAIRGILLDAGVALRPCNGGAQNAHPPHSFAALPGPLDDHS
ncbi:Redox-responsive transcriptional regulator WhiB3 [Mycobacteroides salmoniphilum]|uniref:Transcriptional regulator WhiB n=2 Tax=Mycobacteroides salmoniphilum TaxID=404941 RepID=A0A4R8SH96_9MYCO|nr:Redox-responsive transcriptional regulator WhiB3 [Mycobacteroides salmoniphilum]TEA05413.1 Redox-responsive transcriptional regulator WhiB3 [Mycobacteroides salmoniphilum]